MKHWISTAIQTLTASLGAVTHELNELDWQLDLSTKTDRLAHHLSALSNYPNGGFLVFGIDGEAGTVRGIARSEAETEACYQHAVLKYLSSGAMTNTSLRERFKMHEKQRTQVSNLIKDAVDAGRIKRKDPTSLSSKFTEYMPYWA